MYTCTWCMAWNVWWIVTNINWLKQFEIVLKQPKPTAQVLCPSYWYHILVPVVMHISRAFWYQICLTYLLWWWRGMIECQKLGLTKSIGVSNFCRRQLQIWLTAVPWYLPTYRCVYSLVQVLQIAYLVTKEFCFWQKTDRMAKTGRRCENTVLLYYYIEI